MAGAHVHHVGRKEKSRRLRAVLVLAAVYMVAEAVGGWLTNSLALLADAGHMLSDVAALALALFAIWISASPPTPRRSYGYHRAEILAALVNGGLLIAIAVFVLVEAVQRVVAPPPVAGGEMMVIAAGGLAVNLAGLYILRGGDAHDLNIRGAWLHVVGDTLGSVGAIGAGALVWGFSWRWADPVASILIAGLVLYSAWALMREAGAVLLEEAPGHINVGEVRDTMTALDGVMAVHDLHVWTITSGMVALSCHVVACNGCSGQTLVQSLNRLLADRYQIHHSTLQIERENFGECNGCS